MIAQNIVMKYRIEYLRHLVVLVVFSALTACGGSGGGDDTTTEPPPVEEPTTVVVAEPVVTAFGFEDSDIGIAWTHALEQADDPVEISYTFYYALEQIENDLDSEGNIEEEDLSLEDLLSRFDGLAGAIIETDATSPLTIPNVVNDTSYYFVITATTSEGTSDPSNELRVTPRDYSVDTVVPYEINDTGYIECGDFAYNLDVDRDGSFDESVDIRNSGNHDNHINCLNGDVDDDGDTLPEVTAQDAFSGRDTLAANGTLAKVGAGVAGFDFTKLDSNGNALAVSAESWSCVQDNHSGLIWEVKTTDEGLHNAADRYTWYNTDDLSDGGFAGFNRASAFSAGLEDNTCSGYDENNSITFCNTQAFVDRVNRAGRCGASDWRLPTREELIGLIDYLPANANDQADPIQSQSIDTDYFPNTQVTSVTGVLEEVRYLSASPAAANAGLVWTVYFGSGGSPLLPKGQVNALRLVRSAP